MGDFVMFDRVMTDCDGVGIVVSVDYHGARYDVQTPRLLCKHLPAERVHPVPGPMTLGYRLGRDAAPARRFVARAVDNGAWQRLFDAYTPAAGPPDPGCRRRMRYAFARAAEAFDWRGMADVMTGFPRAASTSPSDTLYVWAADVARTAADGGMGMPAPPRGLAAERARAEARLAVIMPTGMEGVFERERLAAFVDVCRRWGF